jgi:S1-C subfamily serine protease
MFRLFLGVLSLISAILLFVFFPLVQVTPPTAQEKLATLKTPTLLKDSFRRQAKEMTLRVRNTTCFDTLATGSAFPLSRNIVVSNRHVLENASKVELNAWDGEKINVPIQDILLSKDLDLAFIYLKKDLAKKNKQRRGKAGEEVTAVGYPKGKEIRLSSGKIKGYVPGKKVVNNYQGKVMVTSALVNKGNSGGPLLLKGGEVAGIVFAAGLDSKGKIVESYVIPIDAVNAQGKNRKGEAISCS